MNLHLSARRIGLVFLALAALLDEARSQPAPAEPRTAGLWRSIYYPSVEIPSAPGQKCWLLVRSGVGLGLGDQKPGLDVTAGWSGRDSDEQPDALTKPERMSVRLHPAKGGIIEPLNQFVAGPAIGMSGGRSISRVGQFPWGENTLEEAWFELRIDDRVYWLEVPYGFTRDPMAPLATVMPEAGPGALAPAMNNLAANPEERVVVPWTRIEHDLGVIQNGWRLRAEAMNGEQTRWFTTLYREGAPWTFSEALTWPRIVDEDGARVEATHIGSDIPDPFRRVDRFSFAEYPKNGRSWGTLIVTVDDNPTRATIPSSLFKRDHAAAGRMHPQRVVADGPR